MKNNRKNRNVNFIPHIEIFPLVFHNEADIADVRVDIKFSVNFMRLEKLASFPELNNSQQSNVWEFSQPLEAAENSPISVLLTTMQGKGVLNIHCIERNGRKHVFTKDYDIFDPNHPPLKVNNEEDEVICNTHDGNGWFLIELECIKGRTVTFKSNHTFDIAENIGETLDEEICNADYNPQSNRNKIYTRPSIKWQELTASDGRSTVNIILIKRSGS